jgi:hypothetical protein
MVHTTVRPVFTVLRTVRITMAAARASSPAREQSTAPVSHNRSQDVQGIVTQLVLILP